MNRLSILRHERKLTQSDIAKILNISQPTYNRYENEISSIPIDIIINLCNYYNVSSDYIFYNTNIKNKYSKTTLINPVNRLKDIREDRDLSQYDIANILNIKRSTYSDYESGIIPIGSIKLVKLAKFYNLPTDYILCLTDERIINNKNK